MRENGKLRLQQAEARLLHRILMGKVAKGQAGLRSFQTVQYDTVNFRLYLRYLALMALGICYVYIQNLVHFFVLLRCTL